VHLQRFNPWEKIKNNYFSAASATTRPVWHLSFNPVWAARIHLRSCRIAGKQAGIPHLTGFLAYY
jgi:hypothetical protein